jgi:hypothetical protein
MLMCDPNELVAPILRMPELPIMSEREMGEKAALIVAQRPSGSAFIVAIHLAPERCLCV